MRPPLWLRQLIPQLPEINGWQEILNHAVLPVVQSAIPFLSELNVVNIIDIQTCVARVDLSELEVLELLQKWLLIFVGPSIQLVEPPKVVYGIPKDKILRVQQLTDNLSFWISASPHIKLTNNGLDCQMMRSCAHSYFEWIYSLTTISSKAGWKLRIGPVTAFSTLFIS